MFFLPFHKHTKCCCPTEIEKFKEKDEKVGMLTVHSVVCNSTLLNDVTTMTLSEIGSPSVFAECYEIFIIIIIITEHL